MISQCIIYDLYDQLRLSLGAFSGRLWPDWGNTARAAMVGLGSIVKLVAVTHHAGNKSKIRKILKNVADLCTLLSRVRGPLATPPLENFEYEGGGGLKMALNCIFFIDLRTFHATC